MVSLFRDFSAYSLIGVFGVNFSQYYHKNGLGYAFMGCVVFNLANNITCGSYRYCWYVCSISFSYWFSLSYRGVITNYIETPLG